MLIKLHVCLLFLLTPGLGSNDFSASAQDAAQWPTARLHRTRVRNLNTINVGGKRGARPKTVIGTMRYTVGWVMSVLHPILIDYVCIFHSHLDR